MKRMPARLAWVRLTDAATPYGLRMRQTEFSPLPELVILRPDGSEVGRLRYFELPGQNPHLRSMYPHEVSDTEQAEVDRLLSTKLGPILERAHTGLLLAELLQLQQAQ